MHKLKCGIQSINSKFRMCMSIFSYSFYENFKKSLKKNTSVSSVPLPSESNLHSRMTRRIFGPKFPGFFCYKRETGFSQNWPIIFPKCMVLHQKCMIWNLYSFSTIRKYFNIILFYVVIFLIIKAYKFFKII